jgi:hypothetical protein
MMALGIRRKSPRDNPHHLCLPVLFSRKGERKQCSRGRGVRQLSVCLSLPFLLLFLSLSFPLGLVNASEDFVIPTLDHDPIDVSEALRLGRAVRPFVVEWNEDEADLILHANVVGADDDSTAFGHKVTIHEVVELLETPGMNRMYTSRTANHILALARVGYLRVFDEFRLGGTSCTSTWRSEDMVS